MWLLFNVVIIAYYSNKRSIDFKNILIILTKNMLIIALLLLFSYIYLWPSIHLSSRVDDMMLFGAGDNLHHLVLLGQEFKKPGFLINASDLEYKGIYSLQRMIVDLAKTSSISPSDIQNRIIYPMILALSLYCTGISAFYITKVRKVFSILITPFLLFSYTNIFSAIKIAPELLRHPTFNQWASLLDFNLIDPFSFGFYLYYCFAIGPGMYDLFGVSLILTGLILKSVDSAKYQIWSYLIILGITLSYITHSSIILLMSLLAVSMLFYDFKSNKVANLSIIILCIALIFIEYSKSHSVKLNITNTLPNIYNGIYMLLGYPHFWFSLFGLYCIFKVKQFRYQLLTIFFFLVFIQFIASYAVYFPGFVNVYPRVLSSFMLIVFSTSGIIYALQKENKLKITVLVIVFLLIPGLLINIGLRSSVANSLDTNIFYSRYSMKSLRDLSILEERNIKLNDKWQIIPADANFMNMLYPACLKMDVVFVHESTNPWKLFSEQLLYDKLSRTSEQLYKAKSWTQIKGSMLELKGTGIFCSADKPPEWSRKLKPTDRKGDWLFYRVFDNH